MTLPTHDSEAAKEIGRLVSRIVELAPKAGLYVGIKIEPARSGKPVRGEQ